MSVPNWPPNPASLAADLGTEEALLAGVLWRRMLGFWVDLLLIGLLVAFLWAGMVALGVLTLGFGLLFLGALPAVPPLYHVLFLLREAAATPGQALFGLTVRRVEDLGRPGLGAALLSVLGFYATLALGAIWLGIALFTRHHRTAHDLLAGLVVVRRRGLAALTPRAGVWNMPPGGGAPA